MKDQSLLRRISIVLFVVMLVMFIVHVRDDVGIVPYRLNA